MTHHWLAPLLTALALTLQACQAETSLTAPVNQTGTPIAFHPEKEAPDDTSRQLALVGVEAAQMLGATISKFGPLASGFYDARGKHSSYRVLSGVSGWEYRYGWYFSPESSSENVLRCRFLSETNVPPNWDVTDDGNYGPDFHEAFPSDLTSLRMDLDQPLATTGRLAVSLMAVLPPEQGGRIEAYGSGSASVPNGIGQVGVEALNAMFPMDGAVERGDLGLKVLYAGATYQFSGDFNAEGLNEAAKLMKNGHQVGLVQRNGAGWEIKNEAGAFALK